MKNFLTHYRRAVATALVLTLLLPLGASFVPTPAHAADWDSPIQVAKDIGNFLKSTITAAATASLQTKEFALDPIAWAVSKMAIQSMTKSLVNWINSGFNGSPAFVTDLEGHLRQVGDSVAGPFLSQLGSISSLRSPFQSIIAQAVGNNYYLSTSPGGFFTQAAYTLNQVSPNDAAFLAGDFRQGGFNALHSAFFNQPNNIYGAHILANEALGNAVGTAQQTALTQLNWGQGFLSWCGSGSSSGGGQPAGFISPVAPSASAPNINCPAGAPECSVTPGSVALGGFNSATTCRNADGTPGTIQTPGAILASMTSKTLGLSGDQLVTADEFNEIIGALMSQLTTQVIGATGLSGVSSVSSGGNGFIDKAADPSQYTAAGSGGSSPAFAQAVTAQIQQVTQYQTDWNAVSAEAALANTAAPGCTAVTDVISQAADASKKATSSLTLLNKIQADMTSAGTNSSQIASASSELQQALLSPDMPSASDIALIHTQSQSTPGATTLMNGLTGIAATGVCATL